MSAQERAKSSFHLLQRLKQYRFEWKFFVLCATFVGLFLHLGIWQLERAEDKRRILIQLDERAASAPKKLWEINWQSPQIAFQPIEATGRFDNKHIFLLDNRVHKGRVGYEVIQPFYLTHKQNDSQLPAVFINRGWIAAGRLRNDLPTIEIIRQIVTIRGTIYIPQGKPLLLGDELLAHNSTEEENSRWPKVVITSDIERLSGFVGQYAYPYIVRLDAGTVGAYQRSWKAVNMPPEKHLAYAIQWFGLAAALAILYVVFSTRKK